jgi:hypothetical protein
LHLAEDISTVAGHDQSSAGAESARGGASGLGFSDFAWLRGASNWTHGQHDHQRRAEHFALRSWGFCCDSAAFTGRAKAMMLGQLPGMDIASGIAVRAATPPAPPTCSWLGETFDFFTDSSAWQACQNAKEQAQVQAVADNAAHYYGPDSVSAQVAQQAADIQSAQAAVDAANTANYYRAGVLIADPTNPGGLPSWALAALVVGGLLLIGRA